MNLMAITNKTAAVYQLKRKDIYECMLKSMIDYENVNELREKLLLFRFK
jgi:hypothetical protein